MTSKVSRCTIFQDAWLTKTDHSGDTINTWAIPSKSSSHKVFCKACNELVSVKNGGIIRLKEHGGTDKHAKNISNLKKSKTLDNFFAVSGKDADISDDVCDSEIRWCLFTAEHDLSFRLSDCASDTFKKMFHDSKIATKMQCKRTKTMYVTSFGIGLWITDDVIAPMMKKEPFFILLDEGSIRFTRKWLVILVRYLCEGRPHTDFFVLEEISKASADDLLDVLMSQLKSKGIPTENCLGIMSDSANVMRGEKGGVIAKFKKEAPHVLDVGGCCLHHIHNSASQALEKMNIGYLEQLLEDLFIYLRYSKAATSFAECQKLLDMDPLKFLRHVPSRWLQIFDVLSRMIALFDALRRFFSSLPSTEKKKKRVQDISSGLNSPDTIVYIHFITFALKPLKKFELQFQRSDVIIHLLHANMTDLIGNTLTCFVKPEYVDNVKQMKDFQSIPESQQLSTKTS